MNKKEIVDILEIILDGLTAGESTEKKLEETEKFYADELSKSNTEKQFYERVVRFCLFERYACLRDSFAHSFKQLNGSELFFHQSQFNATYDSKPMFGLGFSLDDFNRFVDEYLTAARNDATVGIKEETK